MRRPHAKGGQDGCRNHILMESKMGCTDPMLKEGKMGCTDPMLKEGKMGCTDPMLKEGKMVHGAASIKLGGYLPLRRALGVISSMSLLM